VGNSQEGFRLRLRGGTLAGHSDTHRRPGTQTLTGGRELRHSQEAGHSDTHRSHRKTDPHWRHSEALRRGKAGKHSLEALRDTQRHSEVFRGTQRHALRGTQRYSEALRGTHSEVFRGTQRYSEAGTQRRKSREACTGGTHRILFHKI
jgi:hypothetical protein